MKVFIPLACICTIYMTRCAVGSVIQAPVDVISYDDITHDERKELDYLKHKFGRPKRSGSGSSSGDILESLKVAIGEGIKNKIGEIAKGSAAASARLSSSSSSNHGYNDHHTPHYSESYDHKSLDFWSLKKSILNTLLQAVKAIKGGVIAVKGQLIKGSGYLTAATGKLIVAKGDAVTNLGKKIAASAVLVPYHGHSDSGHAEYGPPSESHYSAPSAPEEFYHGTPSATAPGFHDPEKHYPYHDDEVPQKGPSGLLILKKIYGDRHHHDHHHHVAEESKVPNFKPVEPSGPSFGTIIGKFLSASSSLDPDKPELFGNTATGIHSHPHFNSHDYEVWETKNDHEVKPSASGYVINEEAASPEEDVLLRKPSHNSPFEIEPNYLNQNFDEYIGSSSKSNPLAVKPPNKDNFTNAQKTRLKNENSIQKSPNSSASTELVKENESKYSSDALTLINQKHNYPHSFPNMGNTFLSSPDSLIMPHSSRGELSASLLRPSSSGQNLHYIPQSPSIIDLTKSYHPPTFDGSVQHLIDRPSFSDEVANYHNSPLITFKNTQNFKNYESSQKSNRPNHFNPVSINSKHNNKNSRHKYLTSTVYKRRPSSTRITSKNKPKQTYDVVKSIAYELGPKGPKRLT